MNACEKRRTAIPHRPGLLPPPAAPRADRGARIPARRSTRRVVRGARPRLRAAFALGLAPALLACDLGPAFVRPGDVVREPGTANVSPVPNVQVGRDDPWTTDFVGWQFGGTVQCANAGPGAPGELPIPDPFPTVVEIWDGLEDVCDETPPEGARVVRIELSALSPGGYTVAQQCVARRVARFTFAEVRGGAFFSSIATEGNVQITALDADDVLSGTFSVRFADAGFTSGGFSAEPGCTSTFDLGGRVGRPTGAADDMPPDGAP